MDKITDLTFNTWVNAFVFTVTTMKMKEQNSKMKLFKDSWASSKAKSKGFWSFLKGKKWHDYPAHIVDPDNKNNILTEEIDIKTSLQQHFSSIGKNERIDPSFKSSQ
jgi:hypothetical protein